jgi:hypothetical protein
MKQTVVAGDRLVRTRWAAIGAAVAVSLGGGGLLLVDAAGGSEASTVAIDPVRILDTRDPVNVGLAGPFVSAVSQKLQVTGSVPTTTLGTTTVVPIGASGVLLNVTAASPAANGFIAIRPGDAIGAPGTSSLNVNAGVTVPNAVTVALPTTGPNAGKIDITFDAYGIAGPITDILIDVVGYITDNTLNDILAADGIIPSGRTVTGVHGWDYVIVTDNADFALTVPFPVGRAPLDLTEVNFAPDPLAIDDDATCTGTSFVPTAPPGKLCIYSYSVVGADELTGFALSRLASSGFGVIGRANGAAGSDMFVYFSWAYTAP